MNRLFVTTAILAVLLTAAIPFAQTIPSAVAQEEEGPLVTVEATDKSGEELVGMWISVSLESGEYFGSGYTPLTFPGTPGDTYVLTMSDYDGIVFDEWENGNTERTRTITLADDPAMTVLTAQYDTGMSMRGVTPITYEDGGPGLTVEAMQGDEELNIWTIIDPQPNGDASATFTVYAGNYQHYIFDGWSDGNSDRVRTLTIEEDTTITALYKQAESVIVIPFGAFDPANPPYEPVELSVARGETVLVHNVDVAPHSVTSGTGPEDQMAAQAFETGLLFQDEYAHIETGNLDEGEYDYYCFVHPYMQGRLIVTE